MQSGLGTASDPTAEQNIYICLCQKSGQCPVTLTIGVHHLAADDLSVFHIIEFELLCVTKMLEDHVIMISYCYSHMRYFLLLFHLCADCFAIALLYF